MTKKSYTTTIKTEAIDIDGIEYIMKQASAGVAREYKNRQLKAIKMGANGKPAGFDDLGALEIFLVSKCLFLEGKEVSFNTIANWNNDVVKSIYDDIREMSNLKDDESIREKFGQIFTHEESPISMDDLREWAEKFQDNEDVGEVYEWLQPTAEEKAKNLRPNLTPSSE